jgi:hypothetical protein
MMMMMMMMMMISISGLEATLVSSLRAKEAEVERAMAQVRRG